MSSKSLLERQEERELEREVIHKASFLRASESIIESRAKSKHRKDLSISSDLFSPSDEFLKEMKEKIKNEIKLRESPMFFVNEYLSKYISLVGGSLALVTASTGVGKSTLVANISAGLLNTQKAKQFLIISNEENESDIYKRICCLMAKKDLIKFNKLSSAGGYPIEEKNAIIDDNYDNIKNKIIVIGKNTKNAKGEPNPRFVTTLEGMSTILDLSKNKFECIIIDYYQNINESTDSPSLGEYDVQARFAEKLNHIKDSIGCPIILMSQIKKEKDDGADYKSRIDGRKKILDYATEAFDLKRRDKQTILTIKKDRWTGQTDVELVLDFDGGRYIECRTNTPSTSLFLNNLF